MHHSVEQLAEQRFGSLLAEESRSLPEVASWVSTGRYGLEDAQPFEIKRSVAVCGIDPAGVSPHGHILWLRYRTRIF